MQDNSDTPPNEGTCCGPATPPDALPPEEVVTGDTIQIVAGKLSHQDAICPIAGGTSYLGTNDTLIPVDEEGP